MATLAVVILTKNEEKNIQACIESASFADDILVVDSGSEDHTEELAVSAGARLLATPWAKMVLQDSAILPCSRLIQTGYFI